MLAGAKHACRIISLSSSPLPSEPFALPQSWRGLLERAGASSAQTWQRFCFYDHSCRFRLELPGPVGVCRFRHQSVRVCLAFPSSKSINEKRVQVAGKVAKSLARFIEPMECLPVPKLPAGRGWLYEIKLDGWRLESVKTGGKVILYSRRGKSFNSQFRDIANALSYLPDETVIDGEVVAIDENGRPNFNLLQNFRSAGTNIQYFAFDILMLKGKELTRLPLSERRQVLASVIKPDTYVEISEASDRPLLEMVTFVRKHSLEGIVAKHGDSVYQPGLRTGLWCKQRLNRGQEFVVGGFVPSHLGIDSLVVGFYRGKDLYYAARVRAGFIPATRLKVFEAIKQLKTQKCPFVNLPEKEAGRWGQGLTAEKMKLCVWVRPEAVAQIDFLEWTGANHLRHTKFVGLRDDKDPHKVVRET
jgi:DNA ligase D-like protein (predicted ligase)